ncbi:MAG: hypothetical protein LBC08_03985 [Campylobacteraceae bacterium]|jgi:hypothetical protein|nr:hypothetical protein [Campylobacteraceae bacterium]
MEEKKHSGLGIASFTLSVIDMFCIFILLIVASTVDIDTDRNSIALITIGTLYYVFVLVSIVGIGLGISGLFSKDRKQVFSILGLVLSVAVLLVSIAIFVIGLYFLSHYY